VPLGLGSYSKWDRRLEGEIGSASMSLNAIKGVEMGLGFEVAGLRGSQVQDEYLPGGGEALGQRVSYTSNRAGGVTGGMSTGQLLAVRAAMKPISTLKKPLRSVHLETGEAASAHFERSDVCAVPSAAVISESLLALVLANAVLEKFGGDSMAELLPRVREWNRETRPYQ
jgi:chorismate synthase